MVLKTKWEAFLYPVQNNGVFASRILCGQLELGSTALGYDECLMPYFSDGHKLCALSKLST